MQKKEGYVLLHTAEPEPYLRFSHLSHVRSPHAFVTTDAVKLREIGMNTDDHIGSIVVGLLAGIAPASCPEALRIHAPEDDTIFPPSTVSRHAFTMV